MLTALIFGGILAALAVKYYFTLKPFFDLQKKVKHYDWGMWKLFGTNCQSICQKFREIATHYDSLWLRGKFTVIIRDPEDIKTVLNAEESFEMISHVKLFTGMGLLIDSGEWYEEQRKTITPFLRESVLVQKVPLMNDVMDKFFRSGGNDLDGVTIDAYRIGMQIFNRATPGVLFNYETELDSSEVQRMRENANL